MFMKEIVVRKGNLELTLCQPSFEDGYDPYRHDTVCGASEEFEWIYKFRIM